MRTSNVIAGIALAIILFIIIFQWLKYENDEPAEILRDTAQETSDQIKEGADELKDAIQ